MGDWQAGARIPLRCVAGTLQTGVQAARERGRRRGESRQLCLCGQPLHGMALQPAAHLSVRQPHGEGTGAAQRTERTHHSGGTDLARPLLRGHRIGHPLCLSDAGGTGTEPVWKTGQPAPASQRALPPPPFQQGIHRHVPTGDVRL